mmetsp:Transcript_41154/g.46765  ORF Transcript_41154/g.46765 Transcript_41154/m.46765 type:complete len:123 (-) Transcript_41154:101-469(-)
MYESNNSDNNINENAVTNSLSTSGTSSNSQKKKKRRIQITLTGKIYKQQIKTTKVSSYKNKKNNMVKSYHRTYINTKSTKKGYIVNTTSKKIKSFLHLQARDDCKESKNLQFEIHHKSVENL